MARYGKISYGTVICCMGWDSILVHSMVWYGDMFGSVVWGHCFVRDGTIEIVSSGMVVLRYFIGYGQE